MRDVTLAYNIPSKVLASLGLGRARIYATAKNFFTFSSIDNYDPERGGGISFPMTKQLCFWCELGFLIECIILKEVIMKKNIFVLTSLMLTLGCGCDSFLDETNYSDVTSEGGYYDTEAGLNAVVNACYTPLRFWAGKEDAIGLSETGTDIIAAGSGCVDNNMAAYTQSLDGTNSACTFYFDRFYAAINWCNTAIFHAQTVPNPSNDEILATTLNKREAEARVLRTFYYWILTETFGDTYYTDQPSTSIVMNPVKTSTDNIYQYMF